MADMTTTFRSGRFFMTSFSKPISTSVDSVRSVKRMYVCMNVCLYVCILHTQFKVKKLTTDVCMYVCMYVCMVFMSIHA